MCRHLAYLGPQVPLADVVTVPEGGLYEQSWAPRRQSHGTVNADGFGLGWYPDAAHGAVHGAAPARYRRSVPVWADPNLPDLTRSLRSGAVLAAVRDATPGTAQDETAAAPYAADGLLFSHNGSLEDWQRLPDDLCAAAPGPSAGARDRPPDEASSGAVAGSQDGSPDSHLGAGEAGIGAAELLALESRCDSALLWALLLRSLRAGRPPAEALAGLVRRTEAVRPGSRLNCLLTDGRTVTATRWGDTLWYRRTSDSVVVASEPDGRSGWREVPDRTVLSASAGAVDIVPLSAVPQPLPPLREGATA